MSARTIAIGDIHGCSKALEALLNAIQPTSSDTIITLGDYVDRGSDSKGVIERLIALEKECQLIPLLGNHEEMMLEVVRDGAPPYSWLQHGGIDTLDSYGFGGDLSVIPETHRRFLDDLVDYFETDSHFFVHANYESETPFEDQPADLLRWVKLTSSIPDPHFSGKKAILGHTHDRGGEIFSLRHLTCIDTYCYGGGWLTALDVMTGTIWQADREGRMR